MQYDIIVNLGYYYDYYCCCCVSTHKGAFNLLPSIVAIRIEIIYFYQCKSCEIFSQPPPPPTPATSIFAQWRRVIQIGIDSHFAFMFNLTVVDAMSVQTVPGLLIRYNQAVGERKASPQTSHAI